eukprot:scpid37459/ scgid30836/ 
MPCRHYRIARTRILGGWFARRGWLVLASPILSRAAVLAVPSTLYASTANTGAFAVAPTTLVATLHGALGDMTRTALKPIEDLLKSPELQKKLNSSLGKML